jgi:quinoprotein glucose dehydrogenase
MRIRNIFFMLLIIIVAAFTYRKILQPNDYSGWTTYAGSKDGIRYSSNMQLNPSTVQKLSVAWTFSTNDKDTGNRSQIQCNPIVVDGVLYGTSPRLKLFALDAVTGKPKWIFDPVTYDTSKKVDPMAFYKVSRGVMYWQNEQGKEKRIFYSAGNKTFCIDALKGTPVLAFGKNGYIDLSENLDRDPSTFNNFVAGTTPGIVFKDLIIMGMKLTESEDAAPGHIRAFDVHTGERKWIFHTIPHPGDVGYDTWPDKNAYKKFGGANNWSGMSLDEKRGIVYVPTGSIGGDFYGGNRKGQNLFSNSLIALDAATGKYLWHFQVVHHDIWDRDLPTNPNLVTLHKDGKTIDAVAQITKHGYIFLFDRTNGKPIFPINEIPVPQNALPGEEPWPTQPIPTLPEPFARQHFGIEDISDITPSYKKELIEKFKAIKYNQMFTPPSKEGIWIFPGFDGGGEWGGSAVDPESGIIYINNSEMPWSMTMVDAPIKNTSDGSVNASGKYVYQKYCSSCHGADAKGIGNAYPSLVNLEKKYNEAQLRTILENGKNMMPGFNTMPEKEKLAVFAYLLHKKEPSESSALAKEAKGKTIKTSNSTENKQQVFNYNMTGYIKFLDKDGYAGIKPPWGNLNAVDLNSGKLLWKVPLGEHDTLTKRGIPKTGTETYGGPLVTKGGLIFIAGTQDSKIRAFDKTNGKEIWQALLPAPGYATPATYSINGKQFVVIACGGGKMGSKSGDQYVAFALNE